jgi:hypothetical protein
MIEGITRDTRGRAVRRKIVDHFLGAKVGRQAREMVPRVFVSDRSGPIEQLQQLVRPVPHRRFEPGDPGDRR